MDFNPEQKLAIAKATIELTNPSGSSNLVNSRSMTNRRFEDNVMVFYENDQHDVPSHHNRPLYRIVKVRDIELKRVMLDYGSSLNIIPYPF